MATKDTQMNIYLNTINEGVYGKDIRSAIHDSIEKSYNDAYKWYDESLTKSNNALSNSDKALQNVVDATESISEIHNLAESINNSYEEVTGRIDNIIAHNNDTDGNTELIDIRTTFQGLNLQSAGTAVRSQAAMLNGRISSLAINNPTRQIPVSKPASVTYTLLWENENPTQEFNEQTITFEDIEDTMEMLMIFKLSSSDTDEYCDTLAVPTSNNSVVVKRIDIGVEEADGVAVKSRDFKVGISSIDITNCFMVKNVNPFDLAGTSLTISEPSGSTSTSNSSLVPLRIYAVQHIIDATLQVVKDTELIDARTGVDGTVYETVGDAIRSQIIQYSASSVIDALNAEY